VSPQPADPSDTDLVHVIFPLQADEHGWPPVRTERMWASAVGPDLHRLENAPWFATGVAEGDIVRTELRAADEWPTLVELVEWSGNCTIRVSPRDDGELRGDQGRVLDLFTALGASEGAGIYPLVALTITPDLDLPRIKALLLDGEQRGWWEYDEACVGGRWLDL
jgi:hypothetical protein